MGITEGRPQQDAKKKGFNKQKGSMFKRVKTGLRKVPTQR